MLLELGSAGTDKTLGDAGGTANVNVSLMLIECCRRRPSDAPRIRHATCSVFFAHAGRCNRCPAQGQVREKPGVPRGVR